MSTRCRIGYVREDGKIESIYCHHDGYLSYVGKVLKHNYRDLDKIKKLMSLGDISSIGKNPESTPELWDTVNLMKDLDHYHEVSDNYCCAYKDRGEDVPSQVVNTIKEYLDLMGSCWGEYAYLYENGKWAEVVGGIKDLDEVREI